MLLSFFLPLLQNEMNAIWSMFPFVLNVQPNLRNFVTSVVTSSFLVIIESNNESLLQTELMMQVMKFRKRQQKEGYYLMICKAPCGLQMKNIKKKNQFMRAACHGVSRMGKFVTLGHNTVLRHRAKYFTVQPSHGQQLCT